MRLDELANNLCFIKGKNSFYKVVDNIIFTLLKSNVLLVTLNHQFTIEDINVIKERIVIKDINITKVYQDSDTLIITMNEKDINDGTIIITNIKILLEYFRERSYEAISSCYFCRQSCSEIVEINGITLYGHKNCLEEYKQNVIRQIDEMNKNEKNPTLSIVFSFLGAIIGLIPIIIYMIIFKSYPLLFFIFPPLASFKGYKYGRALINKRATITSICFSFLAVILLYLGSVLYSLDIVTIDIYLETLKESWNTLLYIFIFYIIGLLLSLRFITNTIDKLRKDVEKL